MKRIIPKNLEDVELWTDGDKSILCVKTRDAEGLQHKILIAYSYPNKLKAYQQICELAV